MQEPRRLDAPGLVLGISPSVDGDKGLCPLDPRKLFLEKKSLIKKIIFGYIKEKREYI